MVNNEIEIISAFFLSAHALSQGWEGGASVSYGGWLVLPAAGIAVEIYNLYDF